MDNNKTVLKLKNYQIRVLLEILSVPMHGVIARARNKVVSVIGKKAEEVESERIKLIEKYSKKGTDGKSEVAEGHYVMENLESFQKEYIEVLGVETEFDITETLPEFRVIREEVNNSRKEFDVQETVIYEEICEAFKKI